MRVACVAVNIVVAVVMVKSSHSFMMYITHSSIQGQSMHAISVCCSEYCCSRCIGQPPHSLHTVVFKDKQCTQSACVAVNVVVAGVPVKSSC